MELQVYNGGLGAGAAAMGRRQWEMIQLERQQEASSGAQKPVDTLLLLIDVDPKKYSSEDREYIAFMASQGDKTAEALVKKAAAAGVDLESAGTATGDDDGEEERDGIAAPSGTTAAAQPAAAPVQALEPKGELSTYSEWKKKHDEEVAAQQAAREQALLEAEKARVLALQLAVQQREAELKAMRDRLGIANPSPEQKLQHQPS